MWFTPLRIAVLAALALAVVAVAFLFVPDAFINGYIKIKNIRAFEDAYPDYKLMISDLHYKAWANRLECDSVELRRVDARLTFRLGEVSVGGVGWIELLLGDALQADNFESSKLVVNDAWLDYAQSGYELRCERLSISVPDSTISIDSLAISPAGGDEKFFARSATRKSRYSVTIPHGRVEGTDCLGLIDARIFCGRHAVVENAQLDVLLNKDKPSKGKVPIRPMPNEILTAIKQALQVDSLSVVNASVTYGERFAVGGLPAVITLDNINISVGGLANVKDAKGAAVIRAEGRIMESAAFKLTMAVPLATPEFSFRYFGSLGSMDVTKFNDYLVRAQHVRLNSGDLQEASFDIEVNSGHATGTVRAVYTDLNIAVLDETGRAAGLKHRIMSFLANKMKIRNDNIPDKSGDLKIGRVDYRRQPGDALFQFLWFSLRSGLADVGGF